MLGPVAFTVCFVLGGIFIATVFAELTALNKFAKENNLPGISNNMFKSSSDFWRLRNGSSAHLVKMTEKSLRRRKLQNPPPELYVCDLIRRLKSATD